MKMRTPRCSRERTFCLPCSGRAQFHPLDLGGVELATVRRVDDDGLADDAGVEGPTVTPTDLSAARTDVVHRVDLEVRDVLEIVVLLPGAGRNAVSLGDPDEFDFQLLGLLVEGDALDFTAVEVAFTGILDLHLATDEGGQDFTGQLRRVQFLLLRQTLFHRA